MLSKITSARVRILTLLAFTVFGARTIKAETVQIPSTADTMLHEIYPENNFGAFSFANAGTTAKHTRTRALFKFDLAGKVPAGSRITSASLRIHLQFAAPFEAAPEVAFGLHRMMKDWSEGAKDASAGFGGQLAGDGESTWKHSRKPEVWSAPGGQGGIDFAAEPGSSIGMLHPGHYALPSSSSLVADVQSWLETPSGNFGWMLKSQAEDSDQTAKRFGTRESDNGAILTVEFTPAAPPAQLKFSGITVTDGKATLSWIGGTPPYQLQIRDGFGPGGWANFGEAGAAMSAEVPAQGAAAFFRVSSPGE